MSRAAGGEEVRHRKWRPEREQGKKRDIKVTVGKKINIPDISELRQHGMSHETTPGLRNAAALFSQILKGSHSRRPWWEVICEGLSVCLSVCGKTGVTLCLAKYCQRFFAQQKQFKKKKKEELFIFSAEISLLYARFFVLEQPVLLYIRQQTSIETSLETWLYFFLFSAHLLPNVCLLQQSPRHVWATERHNGRSHCKHCNGNCLYTNLWLNEIHIMPVNCVRLPIVTKAS